MEIQGWSGLAFLSAAFAVLLGAWAVGRWCHRTVAFSGQNKNAVTLETTNMMMFAAGVVCWPFATALILFHRIPSDEVMGHIAFLGSVPCLVAILHFVISVVMLGMAWQSRGKGFADIAESMMERYATASVRQAVMLGFALMVSLATFHFMGFRVEWRGRSDADSLSEVQFGPFTINESERQHLEIQRESQSAPASAPMGNSIPWRR